MKYDVFISYRREGGYDTAKHLNDLLTRDGYKVSFDIDTLRNGDFDTQLLSRIEDCKDFILIVDKHAFDRTLDESFDSNKDWMRCELAHALKHNKNIIPVFLSGVTNFPENLPNDILGVIKKNGPEYNKYYFDDFYKKLKKRFLKSNNHKKTYSILLCIVAVAALTITYFTKSNTEDITIYQNPSAMHSTTIEQFDIYVSNALLELKEKAKALTQSDIDYINNLKDNASNGDAETLYHLGLCYYSGYKVDKDISKAIAYFTKSAEQGYTHAEYSLAVCYDNEIGCELDLKKALNLYNKAAIKGFAPAQNDYAVGSLSKGEITQREAFEWLLKSAKQNYAPAQYHVAFCYSNNIGVAFDVNESIKWLELSAKQNYDIAKFNLAQLYLQGPESHRDISAGFEILTNLVEEEYTYAYYPLGLCYGNGIGVDKNIVKGYELIEEGAMRNDAMALTALAMNYFNPMEGFKLNKEKGLEYLIKAAEQGYPVAQYYIGYVYQNGIGVTKDMKEANKWYDKAALQNVNHQTMMNMSIQNITNNK